MVSNRLGTIFAYCFRFPNKETFPFRHELCYVLQKVAKICSNPIQKVIFEPRLPDSLICSDLVEMNRSKVICSANDDANIDEIAKRPSLVDFLFKYAEENFAIMYIYLKVSKSNMTFEHIEWVFVCRFKERSH